MESGGYKIDEMILVNWSEQEVPLPLQLTPLRTATAFSASMPSSSLPIA